MLNIQICNSFIVSKSYVDYYSKFNKEEATRFKNRFKEEGIPNQIYTNIKDLKFVCACACVFYLFVGVICGGRMRERRSENATRNL